jgi:hypothetical protein
MKRVALGMTLGMCIADAASAQVLTGDAAVSRLYPPNGAEVEILPNDFLPKDQAELLRQVGAVQPYYGVIAISPDEGIMVDATVAAANQHSVDAARRDALAACDAKRKGATPCEVVAVIRPAGWADRGFQLSSGATGALTGEYQKIRRARAFAISPSTGSWGIGKGSGAAAKAIEDCAAKDPKPADCVVVVQD